MLSLPVVDTYHCCRSPYADFCVCDVLEQNEILEQRENEFGEVEVVLRGSRGLCSGTQHQLDDAFTLLDMCSKERSLDTMTEIEHIHKADLMLILVHEGWRPDLLITDHRIGDERLRLASSMCLRNKYYYAAVVHLDFIFAKGVPVVLAHMPEAYYRCLLEMWELHIDRSEAC